MDPKNVAGISGDRCLCKAKEKLEVQEKKKRKVVEERQ
jgi:hypothetical protein